MKINLLRMIIIATAFNSLQIHGMYPSQQLALQAQLYYQAQIQQQQPQHNYNTVVTTAPTATNKPASLTINNPVIPEKKFTTIAMGNNSSNINPSFTEEEDNEAKLLMEKQDPTGINCLMENNTLLVGFCKYSAVCTKTTAAKMLCGICTCLAGCIIVAVAIAGKL